jgi:hypothetical protein
MTEPDQTTPSGGADDRLERAIRRSLEEAGGSFSPVGGIGAVEAAVAARVRRNRRALASVGAVAATVVVVLAVARGERSAPHDTVASATATTATTVAATASGSAVVVPAPGQTVPVASPTSTGGGVPSTVAYQPSPPVPGATLPPGSQPQVSPGGTVPPGGFYEGTLPTGATTVPGPTTVPVSPGSTVAGPTTTTVPAASHTYVFGTGSSGRAVVVAKGDTVELVLESCPGARWRGPNSSDTSVLLPGPAAPTSAAGEIRAVFSARSAGAARLSASVSGTCSTTAGGFTLEVTVTG